MTKPKTPKQPVNRMFEMLCKGLEIIARREYVRVFFVKHVGGGLLRIIYAYEDREGEEPPKRTFFSDDGTAERIKLDKIKLGKNGNPLFDEDGNTFPIDEN